MKLEAAYNQYQNMVYERAWSFARTTGLPFDDLLSEGNLIFCETVKRVKQKAFKHDPKRASLSSWLYRRLNQKLHEFAKSEMKIQKDELQEDHLVFDSTEDNMMFRTELSKISDEAKEVVSIFLTAPTEILKLKGTETRKVVRGKLYRHLRKKGWTWPTIWEVFREIKQVLYNN